MTTSPQPSVLGVVRVDGLVLLLRRTPEDRAFPGIWCLPGGKVDPGEESLAALAREVREETAIKVPLTSWTPFHQGVPTTDQRGRDYTIDAYLVTLLRPPMVRLSEEHDRFAWAPLSVALARYPMGPATRIILEEVPHVDLAPARH